MPKITHGLAAVAFCVALQAGTAANAFSISIPTYRIWQTYDTPTVSFPTYTYPTFIYNPPTFQITPPTQPMTYVPPTTQVQNTISAVPVPAALPLMGLAIGALGFAARRRRDT